MQPGRESQTAVMVAMGRAAAHGITPVTRFSDPTAMVLLPAATNRSQNARTTGLCCQATIAGK